MRAFRPDDLPAVSALVERTIDACYPQVYPPLAVAFFKEQHAPEHVAADAESGYTVVVERGGRIVATGTLLGDEIRRVYVDPAFQGRGLGRAIVRELETRARQDGTPGLWLYASVNSRRFYESLGYEAEPEGAHPVGEGQVLRYSVMARSLDRPAQQ